jgi:hypothetical protein
MAGISAKVETRGPLFTHGDDIVNYHVGLMTRELAQKAEIAIKFQGQSSFRYESSPPTGAWLRAVKTRVAAAIGDLKGWEVHDSNIIYGAWLEGVGSRNYPVTRFRGYSMFRKVRTELERKAPRMLLPDIKTMTRRLEG